MSKFRITKRDKSLLLKLSELGLMSTRQIEQLIFSGILSGTVLRRLRKLAALKLITKESGVQGGSAIWMLSPKGGKEVGITEIYGSMNRNQLEHEILMSEIGGMLDQAQVLLRWKPGFITKRDVLKRHKNRNSFQTDVIPDALFVGRGVSGTNPIFALELELNLKSKRRYQKVFETYSNKKGVQYLWYIVRHPKQGERLLQIWNEALAHSSSGPVQFVWSDLNEIKKDFTQTKLHTSDGETISLFQILKANLQPAQAHAHPVGRMKNSSPNKKITQATEVKTESSNNPSPQSDIKMSDLVGGSGGPV